MEIPMIAKKLFLVLVSTVGLFAATSRAADITGAGATFPYPVYSKWAEAYKAKTGTGMNYQSMGSGSAIKQIQAKTVDFVASDMTLTIDTLAAGGLVKVPANVGGVGPGA